MRPDELLSIVARVFGLAVADLVGRSRRAEVSHARQAAMFIVRRLTLLTYTEIGAVFGRDYTTVMAGCREAEHRMQADPRYAARVRAILQPEPAGAPVDPQAITPRVNAIPLGMLWWSLRRHGLQVPRARSA